MNLWKRIFSKKSDKKINDKRQTQVIDRRKNLKNLLDKFYNLLQDDKSETIMVEHYLHEVDIALEEEYNIFKSTEKNSRTKIDISAFENVDDEAINLWRPIPGGVINTVASALNTFMSIDKISSNDEMYSIFGSKKFNQLMIKCKEGYQSWMSKNSGVKYDGNRAMVGLKNLYSDIGKMKTLEDAKKLYEKNH